MTALAGPLVSRKPGPPVTAPQATSQAVTRVAPEPLTADDFEAVALALTPDLWRYFIRRVAPADAEDCLADTLAVLWRRRDRLPADAGDRRAWAYGVARKVAANHRRKLAGRREVGLEVDPPSADLAPTDRQEQALAALAGLAELDRELIRLVVWDGFGVGQAGRILGLRETTARSRYARAKSRLRIALGAA